MDLLRGLIADVQFRVGRLARMEDPQADGLHGLSLVPYQDILWGHRRLSESRSSTSASLTPAGARKRTASHKTQEPVNVVMAMRCVPGFKVPAGTSRRIT